MGTNVRAYNDEQILSRIEGLPTFKGWKKGKYQVAIRSTEDEFDKFDDKIYSYQVEQDEVRPEFIAVHECTTNPGAQGLKNFEKYGNKRCAVLIADHMVYDSHEYRKHKGQYYAYCQAKFWPYHWDDNHNERSGDTAKIIHEGDPIGANIHAAGEHSTQVGGWSIACIVRNIKAQFNAFMTWMNKDKYVTLIILNEW